MECEFNIDGVVVMNNAFTERYRSGNPEYAFAFKENLEMVEATVLGVEWNVSKDGYLKPTVQLQPIHINGFTISNVTGYNGKYILEQSIGNGTVVNISRCGDVIPNIISVVSSTVASMPTVPYTWNATGVDLLASDCEHLPQYIVKNISHLLRVLDIGSVSEGRIEMIVNHVHLTDPVLFLTLTEEQLQGCAGFGSRLIHTLRGEIQQGIQQATLLQWMVGSNAFGRGFGERRLSSILQQYPSVLTETDDNQIRSQLLQIEGIHDTTAEQAIQGIHEFHSFYHRLQEVGISVPSLQYTVEVKPYSGKEIVLTGFRDGAIQASFEAQGGMIGNHVTHKTIAVITKDSTYDNQKTQRARELQIPVYSRSQWISIQGK